MVLDREACHRAHAAKDRRFDGTFFVAVKTTKIYCRPICPVKTPMAKNCDYYRTAAECEAHGFRPCLRCRPELAPGRSIADIADKRAAAVLRQIEAGALDQMSMEDLAARHGVTSRQLRRVVQNAFGVSPIAMAQTRRLLTAKRLLADSAMSVSEVAMASGFGSLRRFNDAFLTHYRMPPSQIRRKVPADSTTLTSRFHYRPPYDWDRMLTFFRARAVPGVEFVDETYSRTAQIGPHRGWYRVAHDLDSQALIVTVSSSLAPAFGELAARIKRQFDLDCDPAQIQAALAPLEPPAGLRLPGAFDPFEAGVRAILGQQVSVAGATTIAGRLAAKSGTPADCLSEGAVYFPDAQTVAALSEGDIAGLGMPGARARTVLAWARAIAGGDVCLSRFDEHSLGALPGFGPWTVQYIAMRAYSEPDAWPGGDLGIKKALAQRPFDPESARPYRSYAALALWATL